jgi:hypothetical protein
MAALLQDALLLGQADEADRLARSLEPLVDFSAGFFVGPCPARLLGATARLNGRREAAATYYLQALAATAKIGFRPEAALTHLELAELLLEGDEAERRKAQEHLDLAIGEFQAMKMQPALAQALSHRDVLKA